MSHTAPGLSLTKSTINAIYDVRLRYQPNTVTDRTETIEPLREAMEQQDGFETAIDQLCEGFMDQGIDTWEKTFSEAEPYLTVTQRLFKKAEYAQALQAVGLPEQSREVDREIKDALEEDESHEAEDQHEVSWEDRHSLLENIARRWGLPLEPVEFHDNMATESITTTGSSPRAEASSSPLRPECPLRRTQTFTIPPGPKLLVDDTIREKNQSSVLEHALVSDVVFSSYQSSARAAPLALDLDTE